MLSAVRDTGKLSTRTRLGPASKFLAPVTSRQNDSLCRIQLRQHPLDLHRQQRIGIDYCQRIEQRIDLRIPGRDAPNGAFCGIAAAGDFAMQNEGNLATAALSGERCVSYPAIWFRGKGSCCGSRRTRSTRSRRPRGSNKARIFRPFACYRTSGEAKPHRRELYFNLKPTTETVGERCGRSFN
jgi:hypothetical protein